MEEKIIAIQYKALLFLEQDILKRQSRILTQLTKFNPFSMSKASMGKFSL